MSKKSFLSSRMLKKLAMATSAVLALSSAGSVGAAEKLTFAYPTNINLSNAPTLMAIGMGYFEEEGLDVDVVFFQGAAVMLPQITQKHVKFGWITPDVMITARQPGREVLPTKMFYNGIYMSPFEVVVLENSAVKSLTDLKGKKIGVGAMSWGNLAITKSMMKDIGLSEQNDYQFLPVGVGVTAYRALTDGSIDALNLFDTFHAQIEDMGAKLRRLPIEPKYKQLFSSGWIAHEDTLKNEPELVVKFGRAASKGVVACNANPEACVKNFWTLYPGAKPAQGTEEEKMINSLKQLKLRLSTMIPEGGVKRMGYYTDQSWKNYVDALQQGGQITKVDIPVDTIYTNRYVKDINEFDEAKVIKEAQAK